MSRHKPAAQEAKGLRRGRAVATPCDPRTGATAVMVECKKWIKKGLVATRILSLTQRLQVARVVILRYHSVQADAKADDPIGRGIVHPAAAFAEQMEWLARTYEPVTLEEVAASLAGARPMPRRGVLITFDDGY